MHLQLEKYYCQVDKPKEVYNFEPCTVCHEVKAAVLTHPSLLQAAVLARCVPTVIIPAGRRGVTLPGNDFAVLPCKQRRTRRAYVEVGKVSEAEIRRTQRSNESCFFFLYRSYSSVGGALTFCAATVFLLSVCPCGGGAI